jgi:hypothetical protein
MERPLQDQPLSAHMPKMLHLQDEIMTTAREVLKNTDDSQSIEDRMIIDSR